MSTPLAGEELTPSAEELRAMLPIVLELQRLIEERTRPGAVPREELGSISCTSCAHHSCN
jgi:hypothetical protein